MALALFSEPTNWVFLVVLSSVALLGAWQLTHPTLSGDFRRRPLDWIFVAGCVFWAASSALSITGYTRLEEVSRFVGALLFVANGITYFRNPPRHKTPSS